MKRPSNEMILAIDVGTSRVKAGLVDPHGAVSHIARAAYSTQSVHGGGFTQEPEDWWRALVASVQDTLSEAGRPPVSGIVLSSQIGTHLLVTSEGRALTTAVTWQDGRSMDDQIAIEREFTRSRLASLIGINLPSGASWPLPRLRWFEREHSAAFRQARYLFQPKEFLIHRLTGVVVGDSSSWRGLVNPTTRSAARLLEALGVSDLSVPIKEPTDVAGPVRAGVADQLGLSRGTPVFVGWNDLNSSLLGAGIIASRQAFDLGGTSEHVGVVVSGHAADAFQPSAQVQLVMNGPYGSSDGLPRAVRYGVSSNGGLVAGWCRSLVGQHATLEEVERIGWQAPPGSNGLMFLPYLAGERAPVWNPGAAAAYTGVTLHTSLSGMVRAALEGVAFNLRQIMELVDSGATQADLPIRCTGGPARMALWNQIKADVFRRQVEVPRQPEVGILGAAMVAATGLGWHASPHAAAEAMRAEMTCIDPQPENFDTYESAYRTYLELYPALRPFMSR